MTVGDRIKKRRKQLNLSVDTLGELIGKNRATIYRYESDEIENMPYDVVIPLAEALRVSPAYIMGWEEIKPSQLSMEYPFLPVTVAAGMPLDIDAVSEGEVEKIAIPDFIMGKWAGKQDIFLMKINGDSMNKVIPNKSVIVLKKIDLHALKNEDIVVFSNDNEYSVKRFFNDKDNDRFIFKPDSNDNRFTDYIISYKDTQNLKIHGKVVMYIVEQD